MNCAHLSHSAKSLVTGDDYGVVKLFGFPVTEKYVSMMLAVAYVFMTVSCGFTAGKAQAILWPFCTCYKCEVLT